MFSPVFGATGFIPTNIVFTSILDKLKNYEMND